MSRPNLPGSSSFNSAAIAGGPLRMGDQPARIVLLDVGGGVMTCQAVTSVCDSLGNVLCLASNMSGPSRVPLLGIYLLTSYPENVLPLTCTQGNFARLQTTLDSVKASLMDALSLYTADDRVSSEPCILQGVVEACAQFRRFTRSWSQAPGDSASLEVIILTGRPGRDVQRQFCQLPHQFDLNSVKRILVAMVTESVNPTRSHHGAGDAMDVLENMDYGDLCGMVDMVTVDCDSISLQKFFYSWLINSSSGSEHLHLVLPPPCPGDDNLIIKCDISEKMINPYQLPFHDSYSIHADPGVFKVVYPPPSKALRLTMSLQQLKVVSVLPRQCICESVVFGTPVLVIPTTCWKMDWDVLETNKDHFSSLASQLHTQDEVLLAQCVEVPGNNQQRSNKSVPKPKPTGYFLLMPSDNKSLLIKSVVPQELLLPSSQVLTPGEPKEVNVLRVQASLSEVPVVTDFNPLKLSSGLFPALRAASLPKWAQENKVRPPAKRKLPSKAPVGQLAISDLLQPRRPAPSTQQQQQHQPGGRLTTSQWSNPLCPNRRAAGNNNS